LTYQDLANFLRSVVPAHVEVMLGEDNMLCAVDHTADAKAYIKYSEGLDFSLQGVRNGDKTDTKVFSFKNENELVCVMSPLVLSFLDGERRI